jgi:hypothetical protein
LLDVDLVHDSTVKILGDGHQFNIESARELNQAKDNIKVSLIIDRSFKKDNERDSRSRMAALSFFVC